LKVGQNLINLHQVQHVDLEWMIAERPETSVRITYVSGMTLYFSGEEADQVRHFFRTLMR
jgi:hypothetical protein